MECRAGFHSSTRGGLPVKHDPLRRRGNAIVALIESRQLGQHGIVVVRHVFALAALEADLI